MIDNGGCKHKEGQEEKVGGDKEGLKESFVSIYKNVNSLNLFDSTLRYAHT